MDYAILSAPVRHVFMIATIWYLTNEKRPEHLQILEIGSWIGASALSWAQGLKVHNQGKGTITCIDAWKPYFNHATHTNEIYTQMENILETETAYQLFCHNVNTIPHPITCQHLRGQSDGLLPLLRENAFDVVFIDGDHAYTSVLKDIQNSISLVKENGIICGDDLNLQIFEVDKGLTQLHAEEDLMKDVKTKRNYHPGVTLAVAEMFGNVSVWGGFWAMQKKGQDWHKISLKNMPIHYPEHLPDHLLTKAKDHFNDIILV